MPYDPTGYVSHEDELHRSQTWKRWCRAATTANITISTALNNGDVLDGVTLATGDRVLVKDQSTGSQNGIYVVGASPARAFDMDQDATTAVTGSEVLGAIIPVLSGTVNGGTLWRCTNATTPVIGTTALTFVQTATGFANPMTTAADLIVGGTSGVPARLAKGSDGQVLTVDPTTHLLVWATPSSGFSNPMTTKGDLIVGDTGGSPIRKAVGSDTQVLTADSASTGGIKWAAAGGGGGGLAQSFVGYNTIGGTWTAMAANKHYLKKITLAADATFTSIDAHVRQNTDNITALLVTILSDNAGSPDVLLAGTDAGQTGGHYLSNSSSMPSAGRWMSIPIGAHLVAGDYWIGVSCSNTLLDIANDGSGSDRTFVASIWAATGTYPSAWTVTTTTTKFSIRASILS